jgi:hypothetical protein
VNKLAKHVQTSRVSASVTRVLIANILSRYDLEIVGRDYEY